MFLNKNLFFFNIYSFNPNHAVWNQRRLFSGNLPGMFAVLLKRLIVSSVCSIQDWSSYVFVSRVNFSNFVYGKLISGVF